MGYKLFFFLFLVTIFLCEGLPAQENKKIRIYIDADFTRAVDSSRSIEKGIRACLYEENNKINGRSVEIVIKDHRGSSPRSKKNLKSYLNDDSALVVFSGLHSPPLLANRDFINENNIIVLDPWAAAGPITRYPSKNNSIFRLSIDDSKAGYTIVDHAVEKRRLKKPFLLLEDTGWGKSNFHTMTKALKKHELAPVGVEWFQWNLQITNAKIKIKKIIDSGADCIFMVCNTHEGVVLMRQISELPKENRVPIFSHWGILGGNFTKEIDHNARKKIDLSFIQTSFSFLDDKRSPLAENVFKNTQKLFPEIKEKQDIKAPNGFIHAYDLTKLLVNASKKVELSGNISEDRKSLRKALENLNDPIEGLIKTYQKPFSEFDSERNPDAHEALGLNDFAMAKFDEDNNIRLIKK